MLLAAVAAGFVVWVVACLLFYKPDRAPSVSVRLESGYRPPVSAFTVAARILVASLCGRCRRVSRTQPPHIAVTVSNAQHSSEVWRELRELCGGGDAAAAALYHHVVTGPSLLRAVLHCSFPFSPLGAVHCRSVMRWPRGWATPQGSFTATTSLAAFRPHRRGTEVDVVVVVLNASRVEEWTATHTFLFFHSTSRGGAGRDVAAAAAAAAPGATDDSSVGGSSGTATDVALAADIGRKFSRLTLDYNPIHVSSTLAKLFGFRRTVAHGMCVVGHCVPHIVKALPARVTTLTVSFRKPVFLPSTVSLRVVGTAFSVLDDAGSVCQVGSIAVEN